MSTKRKEPAMDTIFIAPLEHLGREDLDRAGGKGANLGKSAGLHRRMRGVMGSTRRIGTHQSA
jgi:hypothetical protein